MLRIGYVEGTSRVRIGYVEARAQINKSVEKQMDVKRMPARARRVLLADARQQSWHAGHCGETQPMVDANEHCALGSSGAFTLVTAV